MAVLIGHASIDEKGEAAGGKGGDQTGKELCTRTWYARGWNVLLRPASAQIAEKSARACEAACGNACIGYDQGGRNTLYEKAKKVDFDLGAITEPCECDCSSLMHVCAISGGANLSYGANGCTTRTMVRAFTDSGDYLKLTGSVFLTSEDRLLRGDILVKEGSHTVMVLSNGKNAEPAPEPVPEPEPVPAPAPVPEPAPAPDICTLPLPLLRQGAVGDRVKIMQALLRFHGFDAPLSGNFNEATLECLTRFQQAFNLKIDGICGEKTWQALLLCSGVG